MVSLIEKRLNTREGSRVTVKYPKTYKGKKVLPYVYKVRDNYAVVGLYYKEGTRKTRRGIRPNLKLYKNMIVKIKEKRGSGG